MLRLTNWVIFYKMQFLAQIELTHLLTGPDGNANGNRFLSSISAMLAYFPPYTNNVGFAWLSIATVNFSPFLYTELSGFGSWIEEK